MNIRPATAEDLDLLHRISIRTFTETFAGTNSKLDMKDYITGRLSETRLYQELAHPESSFYFAESGGETAAYLKLNTGTAQTEKQPADAVEIERIYVLAAYHGQGIGQALLDYAVAAAKKQNAPFVWLGVWEHNFRALKFYGKNGFTPFGQHVFTLGSDAQTDILMKRILSENR